MIFKQTIAAVLTTTLLATATVALPAHASETTPVRIPATSAAIWQAIDKETAILDTLMQTGKLEELHHHAFAIRDLVAALPSHSGSLPAGKVAQIKTSGKYVATLAERLDAAGDAKDKAAATSNLRKLKEVLKGIRANE
ncbi:hypothetical protein GALL_215480 [mine drainage metagenome]|uniref:Chemiosmotic efflux system C protein A n=1 Tax=mine drainage metagenome TaxID=410659 RepID=A0A1J5RK06_9ZZZZ